VFISLEMSFNSVKSLGGVVGGSSEVVPKFRRNAPGASRSYRKKVKKSEAVGGKVEKRVRGCEKDKKEKFVFPTGPVSKVLSSVERFETLPQDEEFFGFLPSEEIIHSCPVSINNSNDVSHDVSSLDTVPTVESIDEEFDDYSMCEEDVVRVARVVEPAVDGVNNGDIVDELKTQEDARDWIINMVRSKVHYFGRDVPDNNGICGFLSEFDKNFGDCPDTRFSCFVVRKNSDCYYGVFDRDINKLIHNKLNSECALACCLLPSCSWVVVHPFMFEEVFVPQGVESVHVVNWRDGRLPESFAVIDDVGVGCAVEDALRNDDWSPFPIYDFASGIPALTHYSCNYCEECGGVDMCRHILLDIFDSNCVGGSIDVGLGMKYVKEHVFELLRLRENPYLCSVSSPHVRYGLARSLLVLIDDIRLNFWVSACEQMSYDLYPNKIVPQGVFGDAIDSVSAVLSVLVDVFSYVPNKMYSAVRDLVTWCIQSLKDLVVLGIAGAVDAFYDRMKARISATFSTIWEEVKIYITAILKSIIRICLGYSPTMLVMELVWDNTVYKGIVSAFLESQSWFTAQGPEDFSCGLAALTIGFFVAMGKVVPKMKYMGDFMSAMILCAGAFNRSMLWDQFGALCKWFDGDDSDARLCIMAGRYPGSCAMVRTYEGMVVSDVDGRPCAATRCALGYWYSKYLSERKSFGRDAREMEDLCKLALRYVQTNGIRQVDRVRARPACYMFWGQSGLGKSKIIGKLSTLIATKHKDRYSPNEVFSLANAIYHVNVGDDYVSGYDNQDIWVFDEWLQEKDTEQSPSKSVNLMFTLISTLPCKLNMAACDDKGKTANVALVLGATNVALDGKKLANFVKSIHDPSALEGRLTYRVKVQLKDGYVVNENRVCVIEDGNPVPLDNTVDQSKLYSFKVTLPSGTQLSGDLDNGDWSWRYLVNHVDSEYTKCYSYNPEEEDLDLGVFEEKEEDRYLPQGLWSWLPTWKVRKDAPVYLNVGGEPFSHEFGECMKTEEGAIGAYRVVPEGVEFEGTVVMEFPGELEGERVSKVVVPTFVVRKQSYDVKTMGLGLVLLGVALVGVIPVARKVSKVCADVKEVASIVVDGCKYWWNGETGCYSAEGAFVEIDGRKYFKIYHKGAYKFYPQGAGADMLKLLDNQRVLQQIPVIYDSLFSVVIDGSCVGNAFALTDCRLVLPTHIGRLVEANGCTLVNGKIAVSLERVGGSMVGYRLCDLGGDFGVLELSAYKLNGVRSNLTKICRFSPVSGLCRQVYRDVEGNISTADGTYGAGESRVQYSSRGVEYDIDKSDVRSTNLSGHAGMCGAIYMNLSERPSGANGGVILGFHIANNETLNRRVFRTFDSVALRLSNIVHSAYPPLDNPRGGLGEAFEFESAASTMRSQVYPDGRLGETCVPKVLGAASYKVAALKPIVKDGVEMDPMMNGLGSLHSLSKRSVSYPVDLDKCAEVVAKRLIPLAIQCNPDWVGTYQGAGYLPSIQRSAAVGPPWTSIGSTKDVMCLSFEELSSLGLNDQVLPNDQALRMLEECRSRIVAAGEFESACPVSIKEEARLEEKVEAVASRIFAGAPAHEFILQRRYFMGPLATFLRRNISVFSALGVDPAMYGQLHELMCEVKNGSAAFFDYKKMDQSFTPLFVQLCGKILRSMSIGKWVGDDVHGEDDYIRAVLITRLAFNRLLVGTEIIEPKGGHPSGSALTSILNIVASILLFTYGLSKMIGVPFDEVFDKVFMLFLGDDSVLVVENASKYDMKVFTDSILNCGFTLTAGDKVSEMRWESLEDLSKVRRSSYEFLSRNFTETEGVLSIDRLAKMMVFCEERRALEIVPQAISSLQDELARYDRTGQHDWLERMLCQVKHFGFRSMEEFLGCSKIELCQIVLTTFSEDPLKMKVTVPVYNRKVVYTGYSAQGPDEPSDAGKEEDAEFLSTVDTLEMSTDVTDKNYLKDHMDSVNYASDVFSRPVVIATGLTGVASDVSLMVCSAASSYFYNNFNAQAKLANAVFMRCRFCVKIIVASGPFVPGKLLLEFRPGFTPTPNLIQATANPCTELDLAAASSAVVKFDTLLPGNWMLVEKFLAPGSINDYAVGFDYGTVQLWTLTPPAVSVPYTAYCWLENVELRGAGYTTFTLSPQGKDDKGKGKLRGVKSDVGKDYAGELELKKWSWKVENTPDWLNKTAASVETVGGCVETIETAILGPIGDFIEKVGDAAGDAAGGIAAAFGMSVPPPSTNITCFMQAPVFNQAQMITNAPSVRMAVVQCQRVVTPRTLFGNTGDEMNIKEFVSRASVIGRFPWNGADATGHNLAVWNVMPGVVSESAVGRGSRFPQSPSPVAFVAGTFRMWRGTLKYRLAVVKTAFHTGTLEVVWQMGLNTSTPSTSAQDALSQRYIWDITQSSSIEFEVPYVARTPFTQVYFAYFGQIISASDLTTGRIYVNVINPLTNSSGTVPSNIYIVCYCSGGPDIEFAMPGRHAQLSSSLPSLDVPSSRVGAKGRGRGTRVPEEGESEHAFVPQGGPFGREETVDGLNGECIGVLREVPKVSMWAHLSTIGERVLSLRLLIKRFGKPVALQSTLGFAQAVSHNWYIGYLNLTYAFYVGSWRANIIINPPDYDAAPFPFYWTLNWNGTASALEDGSARMSIAPWSNATVLEVPWYSPIAFREVGDFGIVTLEGPNPPTSLMQFAAGDDFSFGFQMGCPVLFFSAVLPPPLY